MFARGGNQACSAAGAIAWLSGRSGYVANGLRNEGDRNHWPHLRVYGQRIFNQRIAALISVSVCERRPHLLPVQGLEALKRRGSLVSPAQALQNFG